MAKRSISLADLPPHIARQAEEKIKLQNQGNNIIPLKPLAKPPTFPISTPNIKTPRKRKKPEKLEDAIHTNMAKYLTLIEKATDGFWWTSIENRFSGALEGKSRQARGCRAGVPDIHTLYKSRSLWLEVKVPKMPGRSEGKQSKIQVSVSEKIREAGGEVAVVRTLEDVYQALIDFGVPVSIRPS